MTTNFKIKSDVIKMQKALDGNYKRFLKEKVNGDYPYCEIYRSENDVSVWYVMFSNIIGDDDEFKDCEFLIEMKVPETFPTHPPSLKLLTENGIFEVNHNVCLSIGTFHKEAFPAAIGITGYIQLVYSSFIGWKSLEYGIGIKTKITIETIKSASVNSKQYNIYNNSSIMNKFNNHIIAMQKYYEEERNIKQAIEKSTTEISNTSINEKKPSFLASSSNAESSSSNVKGKKPSFM